MGQARLEMLPQVLSVLRTDREALPGVLTDFLERLPAGELSRLRQELLTDEFALQPLSVDPRQTAQSLLRVYSTDRLSAELEAFDAAPAPPLDSKVLLPLLRDSVRAATAASATEKAQNRASLGSSLGHLPQAMLRELMEKVIESVLWEANTSRTIEAFLSQVDQDGLGLRLAKELFELPQAQALVPMNPAQVHLLLEPMLAEQAEAVEKMLRGVVMSFPRPPPATAETIAVMLERLPRHRLEEISLRTTGENVDMIATAPADLVQVFQAQGRWERFRAAAWSMAEGIIRAPTQFDAERTRELVAALMEQHAEAWAALIAGRATSVVPPPAEWTLELRDQLATLPQAQFDELTSQVGGTTYQGGERLQHAYEFLLLVRSQARWQQLADALAGIR